jgi:hypothetical protein
MPGIQRLKYNLKKDTFLLLTQIKLKPIDIKAYPLFSLITFQFSI